MVPVWQFLVIGSLFHHGQAARKKSVALHDTKVSTQFDEQASAGVSSWHQSVGPTDANEACTYTCLLNAKAELQTSKDSLLEAKAAGHLRKLNSQDLIKGVHFIALENFITDSTPSSDVTENMMGQIENGNYRGKVVLKFAGGFGLIAKSNLYKLGVLGTVVDVAFCNGRHAELTSGKLDYSQFAGIQWQDPSLAGSELLVEDTDYIQKYCGNYAFSLNVAGSVINGLLPTLPESNAGREAWVSETLPALTEEVLAFDVQLARALNKIPQNKGVPLWRGAWEAAASLETLQSKPSGLARPKFQSTTVAKGHACNFMSSRNEPANCRFGGGASGCITAGEFFPVQYEIQTVHAKHVRTWNAKEEEFILVPGVSLDVVSVEKVANDKFFGMSIVQLSQWLRAEKANHACFSELADAVEAKSITGAALVAGINEAAYKYVDKLLGLYDPNRQSWETGWAYENHVALMDAMKVDRFKLQCANINGDGTMVNNDVPYYYHVVMRDSGKQ